MLGAWEGGEALVPVGILSSAAVFAQHIAEAGGRGGPHHLQGLPG